MNKILTSEGLTLREYQRGCGEERNDMDSLRAAKAHHNNDAREWKDSHNSHRAGRDMDDLDPSYDRNPERLLTPTKTDYKQHLPALMQACVDMTSEDLYIVDVLKGHSEALSGMLLLLGCKSSVSGDFSLCWHHQESGHLVATLSVPLHARVDGTEGWLDAEDIYDILHHQRA